MVHKLKTGANTFVRTIGMLFVIASAILLFATVQFPSQMITIFEYLFGNRVHTDLAIQSIQILSNQFILYISIIIINIIVIILSIISIRSMFYWESWIIILMSIVTGIITWPLGTIFMISQMFGAIIILNGSIYTSYRRKMERMRSGEHVDIDELAGIAETEQPHGAVVHNYGEIPPEQPAAAMQEVPQDRDRPADARVSFGTLLKNLWNKFFGGTQ